MPITVTADASVPSSVTSNAVLCMTSVTCTDFLSAVRPGSCALVNACRSPRASRAGLRRLRERILKRGKRTSTCKCYEGGLKGFFLFILTSKGVTCSMLVMSGGVDSRWWMFSRICSRPFRKVSGR